MLLAINCNNTNIKFGVVDGDRIVGEWRQHTSAMRTADEHAVWLFELMRMEGIDPKSVTDAIIGSVVPQANFNLRRLCTRYLNCEPLFIGEPNVIHGIKIKGVGAGADRICNTVGASLMFPRTPVVVVDFGTATNFDVVDEEGSYCGGAIAPGPNLSIEALVAAAALLPRIVVEKPEKVIGTTTVGCMHTGVFWGYVGLIEGLVARIQAEYGRAMTVIGTGGLAPLFAKRCPALQHIDRDLTMAGLLEIYAMNRELIRSGKGQTA
jgi:type III pantothenate kinase